MRRCGAGVREAAEGPDGMHRRMGPFRPGASVARRSRAGQTRGPPGICTVASGVRDPWWKAVNTPADPPGSASAVTGPRPYTAGLVSQRPALGCLFEIVETLVLTLIIFV